MNHDRLGLFVFEKPPKVFVVRLSILSMSRRVAPMVLREASARENSVCRVKGIFLLVCRKLLNIL